MSGKIDLINVGCLGAPLYLRDLKADFQADYIRRWKAEPKKYAKYLKAIKKNNDVTVGYYLNDGMEEVD